MVYNLVVIKKNLDMLLLAICFCVFRFITYKLINCQTENKEYY